jgi:hypothetical protein
MAAQELQEFWNEKTASYSLFITLTVKNSQQLFTG